MRRIPLFLFCLLCATAQASTPLPRGVETLPPSAASDAPSRLIFSRDNNAPNACNVELYVNRQVAASLGPGERIALDLSSGQVSLAVAVSSAGYCGGRGPGAAQSVLLRPGETRQFAVMVEPGQVFLAPLLGQ